MAITNHERVGKAMELLKAGLAPFVEREFKAHVQRAGRSRALDDTRLGWQGRRCRTQSCSSSWTELERHLRQILGKAERRLVNELIDVRNRWAHQEPFSGDDADRALDSAERLLTAVSAPQADEVHKVKMELRRTIFDEQVRSDRRRSAGTAIESAAAST